MASSALAPTLPGACKIYVHDAAAAAGYSLPAHLKPVNWRHNRYSQEQWLTRAIVRHPWRTYSVSSADVILLSAKFSQICTARKTYAARYLWHLHLNDSLICNGSATGRGLESSKGDPRCRNTLDVPKLLILTNTECTPPWEGWGGSWQPPSRLPTNYILAVDRLSSSRTKDRAMVVPAVLAGPPWLVGSGSGGGRSISSNLPDLVRSHLQRPWAERRLLRHCYFGS